MTLVGCSLLTLLNQNGYEVESKCAAWFSHKRSLQSLLDTREAVNLVCDGHIWTDWNAATCLCPWTGMWYNQKLTFSPISKTHFDRNDFRRIRFLFRLCGSSISVHVTQRMVDRVDWLNSQLRLWSLGFFRLPVTLLLESCEGGFDDARQHKRLVMHAWVLTFYKSQIHAFSYSGSDFCFQLY